MAREEGGGRREEGRVAHWHPNDEELKTSNMTNDARFISPRSQYNSKGPKYTLIRYRLLVQVGGRCYGAAVQALDCRAALSCASATLLTMVPGIFVTPQPPVDSGLPISTAAKIESHLSLSVSVSVSASVRRLAVIISRDRFQRVLGDGAGSLRQVSGLKRQPPAFSLQAFLILVDLRRCDG
jgi:hypothetical protein